MTPDFLSHKLHALMAQVALRGKLRARASHSENAQQPDRRQVSSDCRHQRQRR